MKNINLLVLSIFILSINVYAKTIHKVLSLDEVYGTTFGNGNYPKDSLEFWEGNNSVKVIIIDNNGREISTINSYKKNTKILSVFFYDVSGEGTEEIIVLTNYNNKNSIYVYSLENNNREYLWEKPYFYRFKYLEDKLNKKFSNTQKLNFYLVRDELNTYYPLNYNSISNYKYYQKEFSNKKIDFDKGEFLGYFDENDKKVNDSYHANYYIKKFDTNLYGKFCYTANGFELTYLYEAYENAGKLINNGKLVYIGEEEQKKETYKNGILNGESEYIGYDYNTKGNYINGKKEGKWINQVEGSIEYFENNVLKKIEFIDSKTKKLKSITITKENKETEKYNYNDKSELVQYLLYDENNKFKEAINYTFFKNSPKESWFKSYDISKAKYIGEYFPVEKRGEILDLNSEIEKVYTTYVRGLKLFSIRENSKEIFIIMTSESGYYGVKEIIEGYRKNKDIRKLKDIVRNGKYELFYPNDYYSEEGENRDELIWQGYYSENKKEGTWEYYLNGIMAEKKNYKEDYLNGLYQKYQWPHDYLLEEGNYKDGEKIGEWKNNPSLFFFSE